MMILRTLALITLLGFGATAQNAPNVEEAKRAIDRRLQKIWNAIGNKGTRTVLFQSVQAGRPRGDEFRFRVSMLVHDSTEGFPRNHFYGKTCVSHFEEEIYTLQLDEYGSWDAQGRMTGGFE